MCGEMGGRTLEAMALLGLGVKRLSITPASVGPVKAMIRSLDVGELKPHMESMLASISASPRQALTEYAERNDVDLSL